jgi:hypothetical protein
MNPRQTAPALERIFRAFALCPCRPRSRRADFSTARARANGAGGPVGHGLHGARDAHRRPALPRPRRRRLHLQVSRRRPRLDRPEGAALRTGLPPPATGSLLS